MRPIAAMSIPAAFTAATAADPARPFLTWYDDRTGDRAELSGATCANWLAKTANLLVDGCGAPPGAVAVVDAPPHWQTAVIMLGCWSAGLAVEIPAAGNPVTSTIVSLLTPVGGSPAGSGGSDPVVAFATADRSAGYAGRAPDVYGLALAPLAAPLREVPPGIADYVTEVRAYGDHFTAAEPVSPDHPATPRLAHGEACRLAGERARALGIDAGGRVLVDAAAYPDPLDWLLAPLVAGASVVLCGHLDPARVDGRTAAERVTVSLLADSGR